MRGWGLGRGRRRPHRRTARAGAVVTAVALVLLPVGVGSLTAHATPAGPSDASRYPCRGYGQMDVANTTSLVMQDTFTWAAFGSTTVGNGSGNITWTLDPYKQPSWVTWLHSLLWIGSLIRDGQSHGNTAALERAKVIAQDWIHDNPYPWPQGPGAGNSTMNRVDVLLCLRAAMVSVEGDTEPWLDAALRQHAAYFDRLWPVWGGMNVGTDQAIALLGTGCVLGVPSYVDTATTRLASTITAAVDAQGSTNEQSTGYGSYAWSQWGRAATAFDTCQVGGPGAATIRARRDLLSGFLDRAVNADGTLFRLGDTPTLRSDAARSPAAAWSAGDGASGAPPAERVSIFSQGFVFGRSGWGTPQAPMSTQSSYSLRFGPGRTTHGHNDHTAVTWQARGRDILVDPGLGQYTADAWRTYYLGPTAHNEVAITGQTTAEPTALTRSLVSQAAGDFFEMKDTPVKGRSRTRGVLVLHDPDVMVVLDRLGSTTATKATTFTASWHVARDQAVAVTRSGATAHASGDGTTTTFLRLPVSGVTPPTPYAVTRGATRPIQGWYWVDPFHRYPAPVLSSAVSGRGATFLTAIVAARTGAAVSVARPVVSPTGTTTYRIGVGSQTVRVAVTRGGTLFRAG